MTNIVLIRDEVTESRSRAGLRCALRGEWTKFWSLRSAGWSVFALALVTYGLCYLSTNALRGHAHIGDPIMRVLVGFNFGQFVMGVLGVLFLSSEYSTSQIRSTMAAMPRPGIVLAAKAIVVGGVGLVLGEVLSLLHLFSWALHTREPCGPDFSLSARHPSRLNRKRNRSRNRGSCRPRYRLDRSNVGRIALNLHEHHVDLDRRVLRPSGHHRS